MKKTHNLFSIFAMVIAVLIVLTTIIEFILVVIDVIDATHFLYFAILSSSITTPSFLFTIGLLSYEKESKNDNK